MNNWWDGTDTLPLGGDLWAVPVGILWGATGGDWKNFKGVTEKGRERVGE